MTTSNFDLISVTISKTLQDTDTVTLV